LKNVHIKKIYFKEDNFNLVKTKQLWNVKEIIQSNAQQRP
jgi:hypothetical protein